MAHNRSEKFEKYILSVMNGQRKGKCATLLRLTLKQLSFLFGGGVQLRLWLYMHGLFRPHTLGCQVLSVGNLTVGGTGKTPVVEVFARSLQKRGRKVAILSRGYKREKPSFLKRVRNRFSRHERRKAPLVVSDGRDILVGAARGGDEPYMLALDLPEVAVLVGKDRVQSGKYAIRKLGCDTLILDDGFQYLSLKHQLDIVLVDRTNPFGNGNVLPRGLLREPMRNIKRAGFIFITKSNGDGAEELKAQLREMNPDAEISECHHCARYLQDLYTREQKPLDFLRGLNIVALSGIAAPKGFEDELERHGANIIFHKRYVDHHRYTRPEILDVMKKGKEQGATALITTEKDAVRFPRIERRDVPVYFLRVEIEMLSGSEAFQEWIARICFQRHAEEMVDG